MRLLLIRHGEPEQNYDRDCLTEKGKKEASILADRMKRERVDQFYVSPLRRARQTAAPTLAIRGEEAIELDWLKEFSAVLDVNDSEFLQKAYPNTKRREDGSFEGRIVWDMMPSAWKDDPSYYDLNLWRETPVAACSDLCRVYDRTCAGLDEVLASWGYTRSGNLYLTEQGTNATIAFFCHFGMTCVILSHLWNVSPFVLWHHLVTAPSSVTELYTEEREKGKAVFRTTAIGDTSHLYAAGEKPSFAARFCSVYENDERH